MLKSLLGAANNIAPTDDIAFVQRDELHTITG